MTSANDVRYWDEKDPSEKITSLVQSLQERASRRTALNTRHALLYGISGAESILSPTLRLLLSSPSFLEAKPKIQLNITRSVVDTATALVGSIRPRAQFMTDGGTGEEADRAQNRSRFVDAVMMDNDGYTLGAKAFRNAGIFGTGLMKVCREFGKIVLEPTSPTEVFVDEYEGLYGKPRSFFHVRSIDKLQLMELFPKHKKAIEDSDSADWYSSTRGPVSDQIPVIQAWHLPSGPEAEDGWEFTTIDGATLGRKPYRWSSPPFAKFNFSDPTFGWYGEGICQELFGLQSELNALLRGVQANFHVASGLKVWLQKGSGVTPGSLNNSLKGSIGEYVGNPPVIHAPDPISAQVLPVIMFIIEQMYAVIGASLTSSRGEIPAGISGSGRSMLVYQNIESKRFQDKQQRFEQFHMDIAERILEQAADEYEENGEMFVQYVGERWVERIDFDDIQGDCYKIQPYPTNYVSGTPAGKVAAVEQLLNLPLAEPLMDGKEVRKVLDFPDLKAELDLDLAPIRLIDERLQRMMKTKEYMPPHPRMDVELAFKRATLAYQQAELDQRTDEQLELIGQFIDDCGDLLQAAMAPPPVPPGMPPALPPESGADPMAAMPPPAEEMPPAPMPANGAPAPMPMG